MTEKRDMLWGLKSISRAAGVSEDTVRRWAGRGAPVRKVSGKWFSTRSELRAWLREPAAG